MNPLPRNVIMDLLPVYVAGEASEETRSLVEEFARHDAEIAGIIRSGSLQSETAAPDITAPDELEMKTMKRVRRSIRRQMAYVIMATVAVLMIPLVAMQFTGEVKWTPGDFIVMGVLLFGSGLAYVLISRLSDSSAYRAAVGVAVGTALLLIWMNLAVGIIGSEDNPANTLYFGVLLIGLIAAGIARFQPRGMAYAMFAMATAQFLVPLIAMMIWKPPMENVSGIVGVFILNAFFAGLFAVSGSLFRHAAQKKRKTNGQ